jgi:NAD(P)-dependent dehydrogenase (short-subunit alcohol dehydrogenase family)
VTMSDLDDRTAVVTGGASGIGLATVAELADRGADVVVADLDEEAGRALAEDVSADRTGDATFTELDVSDEAAVEATVETARETFGSLDVLVNNAAVASPEADGPVTEFTDEGFDFLAGVNLLGPVYCCKHAIPAIKETGDGTGAIVNNASIAALVAEPEMDIYTATKGALVSLTRSIAVEYAPDVRANAVCPGVVETPMLEASAEDDDNLQEMIDQTPLELGQPEDIANAIAFLASDRARYVTGSVLTVDGGYTAQ